MNQMDGSEQVGVLPTKDRGPFRVVQLPPPRSENKWGYSGTEGREQEQYVGTAESFQELVPAFRNPHGLWSRRLKHASSASRIS